MAFDDYEIRTRPMTSDEVFQTLVSFTRDELGNSSLDGKDHGSPVSTIVAEFSQSGAWYSAASRLNELFRVSIPDNAWQAVLLPKRMKTIGGVCDLLAQHARVAVIESLNVFGDRSLAAGAFLVVRRIFADAGADVSDLRPSSPLRPYLCEKLDTVVPQLIRLAPGQVPRPSIDTPVQDAIGCGWLTCIGLVSLGVFLRLPSFIKVFAIIFAAVFWLAALICSRTLKPVDVRFGDARTFADLARILAGERCAVPGFPVVMR